MNAIHHWAPPSRPCLFALSLRDDCVFADFGCDENGSVYAIRVSFDGYGCCHTPSIGRMNAQDSKELLEMVATGMIDPERADPLLRK